MRIILLVLAFSFISFSQTNSRSFDFWIGEWNAEWTNEKGEKEFAKNSINSILNNRVIEENFNGMDAGSNRLKGKSFSVFDEREKIWKQTWVDNYGGYLLFEGGMNEDKMILTRNGYDRKGNPVKQRMIFYNITKNEFNWNWEKLNEQNKWELVWKIHYTREK